MSRELLVGLETRDDAAVYKLNDKQALVQTVDFITPIVDDPYTFGQITAANSLSDIYAMGGRPLTAMNIAGFPCNLDLKILAAILEGGRETVERSGAIIVGGHTVEDLEPKYGLSVTGIVDLVNIVTVDGARPGDVLILTKPLGVGVLATALRARVIDEGEASDAIEGMKQINAAGCEAMLEVGVNSATDITGFGFLGHLHNMMKESAVSAKVYLDSIPVWPLVHDLVEKRTRKVVAGGLNKNRQYLSDSVSFGDSTGQTKQTVLFDPQTSGGLLISVPKEKSNELVNLLKKKETAVHSIVGEVIHGVAGFIEVV